MYRCPNCGEEIEHQSYEENKCPKCRYRILFKKTPTVKRTVKAR